LNEISTINVSDGENPVSAENGDKLMLWNSLDEMKPLCRAIDVGTYDGELNKTIIVYFSRTGENYGVGVIDIGNTARIAQYINNKIDADTFEIIAKEPYSDVYSEAVDRAQKEKNENARPEFIGEIENIDQYDTVFIGYPIWWSTMPMIMNTFLEKYDMTGKTIIPFSTNEGSGWGSSLTDLRNLCPNSTILNGYNTQGRNAVNAENAVTEWLNNLNGVLP
jgi:flavodoxin